MKFGGDGGDLKTHPLTLSNWPVRMNSSLHLKFYLSLYIAIVKATSTTYVYIVSATFTTIHSN